MGVMTLYFVTTIIALALSGATANDNEFYYLTNLLQNRTLERSFYSIEDVEDNTPTTLRGGDNNNKKHKRETIREEQPSSEILPTVETRDENPLSSPTLELFERDLGIIACSSNEDCLVEMCKGYCNHLRCHYETDQCYGCGRSRIYVGFVTDDHPTNTFWSITSLTKPEDLNLVMYPQFDSLNNGTLYESTQCVEDDSYQFSVFSPQDFVWGGSYTLKVNDDLLVEDGVVIEDGAPGLIWFNASDSLSVSFVADSGEKQRKRESVITI